MKLLNLTLCNLASFEGEHVIDFSGEPLAGADLFSIVGETGSGKSTILDAICLALYGLAPRFCGAVNFKFYDRDNESKRDKELSPDDSRNIMRKGTRSCYSEVVFKARDGSRYKARWACSIPRSKYSPPERRLWRYVKGEDGNWTEVVVELGNAANRANRRVDNSVINGIIGLDYDQFTRTMLLAQNSFANFVKAESKDKAKLLEKLTGTEFYTRVGRQIALYKKQADDNFMAVYNKVQAYEVQKLSDAELTEVQTKLKELTDALTEVRKRITASEANLRWLTDYRKQKDTCRKMEQSLAEAKKRAALLNDVRRELKIQSDLEPMRGVYQSWLDAENDIKKLDESVKQGQTECEALQVSVEQGKKQLQTVKEQEAKIREEAESLAPQILKKRQLKVRLDAQKVQVDGLRSEVEALDNKAKQLKDIISKNASTMSELATQRDAAEKFLSAMQPHQGMIDVIDVVLGDLDRLHSQETYYTDGCLQQEKLHKQLKAEEVALSEGKKLCLDLTAQLSELQLELAEKQKVLSSVDVDALNHQLDDMTKQYNLLHPLSDLVEGVKKALQDKQVAEAEFAQIQQKQKTVSEEMTKLLSEEKNISSLLPGMEEAYQLTAGKNAQSLRASLQEGKPCPVCGALEHPYAHDVDRVMLPLKQEIASKRKRMEEIRTLLQADGTGLMSQSSALNARCEVVKSTIERLTTELQHSESVWKETTVGYKDLQNLSLRTESEAIIELLNAKVAEVIVCGRETRALLADYERKRKEIDALRASVDKNHKLNDEETEKLHGSQLKWESSKGQWNQKHQELEQVATQNKALRTVLSTKITVGDWAQRYSDDYAAFIASLKQMQADYQNATAQKQESDSNLKIAAAKAEELQKQSADYAVDGEKKHKALDDALLCYKQEEEMYASMLGGRSAEDVENEISEKRKAASQTVEEMTEDCRKRVEQLVHLQGLLKGNANCMAEKRTECGKLRAEILDFVGRYNKGVDEENRIGEDDLLHYFDASVDWNAKRQRIKQTDEEVATLSGSMKSCVDALEAHIAMQQDKELVERAVSAYDEAIKEQLSKSEAMTAEAEQIEKECTSLGGRLSAHERCIQATADCRTELDRLKKERDDWQELYGILGNADSDTLRESVQVYTLQFLIRQANVHLQMFSKRYSLEQVKNSLGIRVVDHDRADEVRNVSSLSGGETFLVSLALALGLSSLSSRNVPMYNLFVDEGFGTLDGDSLNMVIDALSCLQAMQGKKVGVISHTAEMRERIRTQIRVKRVGMGGKSVIEIV